MIPHTQTFTPYTIICSSLLSSFIHQHSSFRVTTPSSNASQRTYLPIVTNLSPMYVLPHYVDLHFTIIYTSFSPTIHSQIYTFRQASIDTLQISSDTCQNTYSQLIMLCSIIAYNLVAHNVNSSNHCRERQVRTIFHLVLWLFGTFYICG